MSLDPNKLEKVLSLPDGSKRARCPACAETDQDRKGEHLRIYPDGKFGCCVFPGDHEHRRRIFALAGEHRPLGIKVRVAAAKTSGPILTGILGRLGRVFASLTTTCQSSGASDAHNGVEPPQQEPQTPRTADLKSDHSFSQQNELPLEESRTPRTPFQNPCVYPEKVPVEVDNNVYTLKEFSRGVRSVRGDETEQEGRLESQGGVRGVRMPYFTPGGTLVIPFDSPERFHWWKGGQSVAETRAEVLRLIEAEKRKEGHGQASEHQRNESNNVDAAVL